MTKDRIKILVVDDEKVLREYFPKIIETDPSLKVVGTAANGVEAVEMAKILRPDVITMDIMMPKMNGVEALRIIMKENPTPVIMVSSKTYEGASDTLEALSCGAFDYLAKPEIHGFFDLQRMRTILIDKIKIAATAPLKPLIGSLAPRKPSQLPLKQASSSARKRRQIKVVGIVVSTGGPVTLTNILASLPEDFSLPICIVQHISTEYICSMLERFNQKSKVSVKAAEDGEPLKPGTVYFSPGKQHLTVRKNGKNMVAGLNQEPKAAFMPNGNELLWSMGTNLGFGETCGIVLTGMGDDGAWGLRRVKEAGGYTIAQGEQSSVVFSMPQKAIEIGAVDEVLELEQIILQLNSLSN